MSRPESCAGPAGVSPAAVIAGEPRSRHRSSVETRPAERCVESPQAPVGVLGGEQRRRPNEERTLQPRDRNTRKGEVAEPLMSRRRQQTAPGTGAVQDTSGVWRRACDEGRARNRRDPTRRPTSGEGAHYKPRAKGARAGRESEGLVVLLTTATITPSEGRGPALTEADRTGTCKGMARFEPNNPLRKSTQPVSLPLPRGQEA